jgi:hypothetical protein
LNPQSADVIEETNQLPSPESPATEEVQEQTPVSAQVEDEAVAIASETNSTLSNSNGQTGITASDEGSSKGFHFILFASYFNSHFSTSNTRKYI